MNNDDYKPKYVRGIFNLICNDSPQDVYLKATPITKKYERIRKPKYVKGKRY